MGKTFLETVSRISNRGDEYINQGLKKKRMREYNTDEFFRVSFMYSDPYGCSHGIQARSGIRTRRGCSSEEAVISLQKTPVGNLILPPAALLPPTMISERFSLARFYSRQAPHHPPRTHNAVR
jgi:hypothetical protein